eukprot:XP_001704502.1 Hypothetical protein GL50803_98638 [Giardia lamblia ATCC 50803]
MTQSVARLHCALELRILLASHATVALGVPAQQQLPHPQSADADIMRYVSVTTRAPIDRVSASVHSQGCQA